MRKSLLKVLTFSMSEQPFFFSEETYFYQEFSFAWEQYWRKQARKLQDAQAES